MEGERVGEWEERIQRERVREGDREGDVVEE